MTRKLAALLAVTGALFLLITGTAWAQENTQTSEQTVITVQEQIPVQIEMQPAEGATDVEPLSFTVTLSVTKRAVLEGEEVVISTLETQILSTDAPVEVVVDGLPELATSVTALEDDIATESAAEAAPQTVQGTVNRNSNLRAGPGTGFAIVRSVPRGTALNIVGANEDGTWVKLITGEWVAAFLVDGLPDDLPDASRTILSPDSKVTATIESGGIPEDLDKALAEYTAEIEANPTDPDAYYNRGVVRAYMGDFEDAVADFTQAIELERQDAGAYLNRGSVYMQTGEPEKAIADFTRVIEMEPNQARAYNNRGLAYAVMDQYDQALTDYNRAIDLAPNDAGYYTNRADVHFTMEDGEQALEDANRAIQLDPNLLSAYTLRGRIHGAMDQFEAAIADFDKVIALEPDDASLYYYRGRAHAFSDQLEEALRDFDQAIALKPDLPNPYIMRGRVHQDLQNYEEAIADFDEAIALDPDSDEPYRDRGSAHYSMENYEAALADFSQAIELDPEDANGYYNRASLYQFRLDEPDEAVEDWGKVIELAPGALNAYNNRALLLTLRGDHEAALADMAAYAEQAEDGLPPSVLDTRAYVYLRQGDYESAINDYESAIDAGFGSVYPRLGLGIALAESDDMEQALPLLEEGLAEVADYEDDAIDAQLADLIDRAQSIVENAAE